MSPVLTTHHMFSPDYREGVRPHSVTDVIVCTGKPSSHRGRHCRSLHQVLEHSHRSHAQVCPAGFGRSPTLGHNGIFHVHPTYHPSIHPSSLILSLPRAISHAGSLVGLLPPSARSIPALRSAHSSGAAMSERSSAATGTAATNCACGSTPA
jgi:hypothetical protein